jgi:hypothetical protein
MNFEKKITLIKKTNRLKKGLHKTKISILFKKYMRMKYFQAFNAIIFSESLSFLEKYSILILISIKEMM